MAVTTATPVDELDLPILDLADPEFLRDPWAVFRPIQEARPLARSARGIEVLGYEWIKQLAAVTQMLPNYGAHAAGPSAPTLSEFLANGLLVNIQGERHDRIRRVMTKAFAAGHVKSIGEMVERTADDLVAEMSDHDGADLIEEFTHRFSIGVMCRNIGIPPEDIRFFERATLDVRLMNTPDPDIPRIEAALETLRTYVARMLVQRAKMPKDDLMSAMIAAQATEGRLTEAELVWNVCNLLFAGHDTTRFQLGLVLKSAIDHGVWEAVGADSALASGVVNEALRLTPTVPMLSRIVTEDFEFEDVVFSAGTQVRLNTLAATRDPQRFVDPDEFDPSRDPQWDMTFGRGARYCLGANLAKSELVSGLRVLTTRLTDVVIDEKPRMVWPLGPMNGPESLRVRFRRR
jgi:cytochrome P450